MITSGTAEASSLTRRSACLWDPQSGELLRSLQGHTACVRSVAFSHDGSRLASGSADKTIRLWDVASGACLAVLIAGEKGWAAFSPVGRYQVSGKVDEFFWFICGWRRFAPGEADAYTDSIRRIPEGQPLLAP